MPVIQINLETLKNVSQMKMLIVKLILLINNVDLHLNVIQVILFFLLKVVLKMILVEQTQHYVLQPVITINKKRLLDVNQKDVIQFLLEIYVMNVMYVKLKDNVQKMKYLLIQDVVLIYIVMKNVLKEMNHVQFHLQKRNVNGVINQVIKLVKCFMNQYKNILLMKKVLLLSIIV